MLFRSYGHGRSIIISSNVVVAPGSMRSYYYMGGRTVLCCCCAPRTISVGRRRGGRTRSTRAYREEVLVASIKARGQENVILRQSHVVLDLQANRSQGLVVLD